MASESKRRDRQIVRVLGILDALLHGTGASVHDFARRFGTRRETIYRDLRALEDAGYRGLAPAIPGRPGSLGGRTTVAPVTRTEMAAGRQGRTNVDGGQII